MKENGTQEAKSCDCLALYFWQRRECNVSLQGSSEWFICVIWNNVMKVLNEK
jgi:hypothetical protein